ncbi:armadillo-type protein [Lipomyces arxii]|uniref:armadillo-type protein n=1 Tax=Lipomyces arxii TaxID=56418 RepID=UPI0034CF8080
MAIDPNDLLRVLQAAALQDLTREAERKAAETQLKEWEPFAGFYSLLQDAFLDDSLETDVRWISIIYFKNGIDKHWRRSAPNPISKEEKLEIRAKISRTFGILNPQLATQNALAIARISKFDFPVDWPTIFPDLLGLANEAREQEDLVRLKQILVVLNQVVKMLSISRFGKARMALQHDTPAVVQMVGQWYFYFTQQWMNADASAIQNDHTQQLALCADIGYLSLKICRRLVVEGYEFANRHQEASEFFQATTLHLNAFIEKYVVSPSETLEQHIKTLGKFYYDLTERQPTAFIMFAGCHDLIRSYLTILQNQAAAFHQTNFDQFEFWEKVLVRGLLLLRKCIKMIYGEGTVTIKYRTPEDRQETKTAIQKLKDELCTDMFVVGVHDILLWSYLRLRPTDLEKWATDPEEFVHDEILNSWEYQLRPCAEKVYVDLLVNWKDLLRPRIIEAFNNVSMLTDMSDDALLTKDTIYCGFSIGCNALFEDISFDEVLTNIFAVQVLTVGADAPPMYRIIIRRIALIISNWITVSCAADKRPLVYEILARELDPSLPLNDTVVQLTATSALKCAVDEWDFKLDLFVPYLELFLVRLIDMIPKVEMIETKLALLQVISVIMEVSESRILPFAEKIMQLLPRLWEQAGGEHILKGAILQSLTNLIRATEKESYKFHSLYVPLIGEIVDPKSDMHVYLLEDALELWQATIGNAQTATPELLNLVPILIEALDQSTETLRVELTILEAYVILAPQFMAEKYSKLLFSIIASFIGNLKIEACHIVTHIIEVFIQTLPIDAYMISLVDTGLLSRMTDAVFDSYESSINVTRYLTIFARLTLCDVKAVVWFCEVYGASRVPPQATCLSALLDTWVEKIENMGHPRMRKLTAMALDMILNNVQNEIVFAHRPKLTKARDDIMAELEGDEVDLNIDTSLQNLMSGYGYSV